MKHPLAEQLRRTYHTADLPDGNPTRAAADALDAQQVLLARALEALSEPTTSGHCDSVHAQLRVDLMRALGLFDEVAPLRYPHDDMGTPT